MSVQRVECTLLFTVVGDPSLLATITVPDEVDFVLCFVFFFSSRRRHTRYIGDWSSDVCSSDLPSRARCESGLVRAGGPRARGANLWRDADAGGRPGRSPGAAGGVRCQSSRCRPRSEERRVGKSVDLGGRRNIKKKKTRTRAGGG